PVPELEWWMKEHYPGLDKNLSERLEKALLQGKRPVLFALEGYRRFFPSAYDEFCRRYTLFLTRAVENIKVTVFFSRLWWVNYVRNVSLFRQGRLFTLAEKVSLEEDVVVIAAGPSLESSLQELKEWAFRGGKILCCLSSYATLKEAGITPWGVVVSDAGVANVLHGMGLEKDVIVFASLYASAALLLSLDSPVVIYDYASEGDHPSFVLSTPSVVLDALSLATKLFSGKVYVVGLDLAYTTAGTHTQTNILFRLSKVSSHRLKTVETMSMNFLSRGDIEELKRGVWTTRAFSLIKAEVERRFPLVSIVKPVLEWSNPICETLPLPEKTGKDVVFVTLQNGERSLKKAFEEIEKPEALLYLREQMRGESTERVKKLLLDKYMVLSTGP
ncbi:MAG: 6-hydroxymethylpterin diphosphokinase MptE-like protein, partial [Brevinematales bacterium]